MFRRKPATRTVASIEGIWPADDAGLAALQSAALAGTPVTITEGRAGGFPEHVLTGRVAGLVGETDDEGFVTVSYDLVVDDVRRPTFMEAIRGWLAAWRARRRPPESWW